MFADNNREETMLVEETVVIEEGQKNNSGPFVRIARALLFALLFIFPIWFLPLTSFAAEMGKGVLLFIVGLVALIAWIASILQDGEIHIVKSSILWMFGLFLVGFAVAGAFSTSFYQSFVGAGNEATTVTMLFAGWMFAFLIAATLKERRDIMTGLFVTLIGGGLVVLFFFLRSVFNIPFFGERSFNPMGSWNGLGIFFGALVALTFPLFRLPKDLFARHIAVGVFALSLVGLFIVNYVWAWVGVGVLALIFFSLYFSAGERKSFSFSLAFFLIIIATLAVLLSPQINGVSGFFGQPLQVSPSNQGTFAVIKSILAGSPIFGFGPNTFGLGWEMFRPDGISNTPFWRVQFSSGSSFALTLLAEGGILSGVLLLLFAGTVIVMGVRAIVGAFYTSTVSWESHVILAFLSSSIFLVFAWFVSPMSMSLVIVTFMMLGLFIATAHRAGVGRVLHINIFQNAQEGFVASLSAIVLVILGVYGIYLTSLRYAAEVSYYSGLQVTIASPEDQQERERHFVRAAELYERNTKYLRSLTDLQTQKLQNALTSTAAPEEARTVFQNALQNGINYGQRATRIEPAVAANWESLARVYTTAVPLVPDAIDFALENYNEAVSRSPRDPVLYDGIATTHRNNIAVLNRNNAPASEISIKRQEAITALEQAITIKSDYAPAHFKLANLYSSEGRRDEAIARANAAFTLAPNDVGAAFQLGVLHYQNENFSAARAPLVRAIELNPNYANARYFLGLIEDAEGDVEAAIVHFERIFELNPGNVEVEQILTNLRSGQPALTGIGGVAEPPIADNASRTIPRE